MKQRRQLKSADEKLITKPVSLKPALAALVDELAKAEDRSFSKMARILVEEALRARGLLFVNPLPAHSFVAAVFGDAPEKSQSTPSQG